MAYYIEKERKIPIISEYDVIIVGGSQSGCAAAICAARQGAKVLIVEKNCFLGGQIVETLIVQWEKRSFINNLGAIATRGIAKEMLDRVLEKGGSDNLWMDPPGCEEMRGGEEWLDLEAIKLMLLEMCLEANIDILFDTLCVGVLLEKIQNRNRPKVNGVIVENRSGRQAIKAKLVVDASAYLDVVWFAIGEQGVIIQTPNKRMNPGWHTWFGGVNSKKFVKFILQSKNLLGYPSLKNPHKVMTHLKANRLLFYHGFTEILEKANDLGYLDSWPDTVAIPTTLRTQWLGHDRWATELRFTKIDTLDAQDLSRAEIHRQIIDGILVKIFRLLPGWEDAYVSNTTLRLGLRETRMLKAVTMITPKDVFDPDHDRPDAIGRSGGHTSGYNKLWKAYPIPYGALIPKDVDGVICCSRAIGTEPGVPLNAHRGIVPTIVVGQAAGTAAGLAAMDDLEPRNIDIRQLRKILRKNDVVLDVETMKLNTIPKSYFNKRYSRLESDPSP